MKKKKVIIIGAGPAGLSTAYELLYKSNKYEVIMLEESNQIGGISKTVKHHGNRMDIGGHRFFTKIDRVNNFWDEVMPVQGKDSFDDIELGRTKSLNEGGPDPEKENNVRLVRQRVSRIYYLKKFFDYPISLKISTIKNLGFKNTIICGFSYMKSIFIKKKEDSLENFYINRFGKRLYSMFFEKYTEKLWGRHPKDISAEWGAQRVKGLSIISVIKNALKINKKQETSLIDEFTYPKYGPGSLWEKVGDDITKKGGTILLNHQVDRINIKDNKIISVESNNKEFKGDIFISSMPIKDLINSIDSKVPKKVTDTAKGLPYRDFVTIGLLVNKLNLKNETNIKTINNIVPDCWIYVQEKNVKMGRIQIFNNWSPYMVKDPKNTVWIGLEYFCNEEDEFWNKKDKDIKTFATKELISMGIIDKDDILDYHIEKVKKAYPAYFDTYKDFDTVKKYLNKFDNLYCIGRNGQHRYNNMDHSIMTGFLTVDHILGKIKNKNDIWNVNTENEYHEEKKEESKKKNNKNIVNYLIFLLFAIFTFYLITIHEPWRDEAQNFLMAKNMSIMELIKNASIEGHPIVWHLYIKAFISLGLNYTNIHIITYILSLISAGIIIWKFDESTIVKILILCTFPFIYLGPVFLRSYTLIIPLFLLITLLYKNRHKYPIIYSIPLLLISNTHILYTGFVGVLFLIELYEYIKNKDNKKSRLIIIIISLISFILFLIQMTGSNTSYFELTINHIIVSIMAFGYSDNFIISGLLYVCFILYTYELYKVKDYKIFIIYILSILGLMFLLATASLSTYMTLLYLLFIIFSYWNIKERNNRLRTFFILIMLIQIIFSFSNIKTDIKYLFSDSKNVGEYIIENIPKGSNIYCTDTSAVVSIIPYTNNEYHFIDRYTNKEYTYVNWKDYYKYDREKEINNNTNYNYYIALKKNNISKLTNYEVLYESDNTIEEDESYIILKRK